MNRVKVLSVALVFCLLTPLVIINVVELVYEDSTQEYRGAWWLAEETPYSWEEKTALPLAHTQAFMYRSTDLEWSTGATGSKGPVDQNIVSYFRTTISTSPPVQNMSMNSYLYFITTIDYDEFSTMAPDEVYVDLYSSELVLVSVNFFVYENVGISFSRTELSGSQDCYVGPSGNWTMWEPTLLEVMALLARDVNNRLGIEIISKGFYTNVLSNGDTFGIDLRFYGPVILSDLLDYTKAESYGIMMLCIGVFMIFIGASATNVISISYRGFKRGRS